VPWYQHGGRLDCDELEVDLGGVALVRADASSKLKRCLSFFSTTSSSSSRVIVTPCR